MIFTVSDHLNWRRNACVEANNVTNKSVALGVVLLEIGLWQRAETLVGDEHQPLSQPEAVSQKLKKHAKIRLGYTTGETFQKIVLACLNGDFVESSDSRLHKRFRLEIVQILDRLAVVV